VRTPLVQAILGTLVASAADPTHTRSAVRLASTITLVSLVAILGVGVVSIVLIRRHRRKLAGGHAPRRRRRPPPDPWFESGRRSPPPHPPQEPAGPGPKSRMFLLPGSDGSDDDTVDLDPEDLNEGDVEGDEPPGSRGG
jgi:hypothetical protein